MFPSKFGESFKGTYLVEHLRTASDRGFFTRRVSKNFKSNINDFLKKVLVSQKICFKVKVLKTFKISTDCHIKVGRSHKRRAILKIPITFS